MIQSCITLKAATVRDLRNHFARSAGWIKQGEPVEITEAGTIFARLVPAVPERPRRFKMPDIKERLDRTFGEKCDAAAVSVGPVLREHAINGGLSVILSHDSESH